MTKINRRGYLKQMGAGAGIVAGMVAFASSQQGTSTIGGSQRHPSVKPITPPTQFQDWPDTQKEPSTDVSVTLIFGGLMGFFYNPKSSACDIGLHSGKGNHMTELHIWEVIGGKCA